MHIIKYINVPLVRVISYLKCNIVVGNWAPARAGVAGNCNCSVQSRTANIVSLLVTGYT